MTLDHLRSEYLRLGNARSIDDCIELIDIFCNFLITVIHENRINPNNIVEGEATLIFQMIMSKTLCIKSILKGVSFSSKKNISIKIIDPSVLAVLIRNTYETVSMFNLIYRVNNAGDERTIVYNLWSIAGLKYRQRFEHVINSEETAHKFQTEQETISSLILEIEGTALYQSLDEWDKEKVKHQIKKKDYLIRFENSKVIVLHWQELCNTMGCNEDFFKTIYTYFSLYAHPSNVSVFQFGEMFHEGMQESIGMANLNMQYFFMFLSIFISDYIELFPKILETFNRLELLDQLLINSHNIVARGLEYSINDSYKKLG